MVQKSEEQDAVVQKELELFSKAMETGDENGIIGVINRLIEGFGSRIVEMLLARLAAAEARVHAVEGALQKTRELLDSLLVAPRRIERLLAVVPEHQDGEEVLWGLVAGPPVMACRFHKDVDPKAIGDPNDRIFVWLVQSTDGLVIRGRIDVPPLVDSGLEREFVFQGVAEEGDETDEEIQ